MASRCRTQKRKTGRKREAGFVIMATVHYSCDRAEDVVATGKAQIASIRKWCVLYVPTGCQGRQKRRSLCYLADCDLLSLNLTKNNKITSLPHSSSQGRINPLPASQ